MVNIVTHTNVKKDTFTSLDGELLQYYDKQTDTYKPFESGNKYYLQYIISHDESGRNTGLKTYPTPFYIKPLLGVSYAHIRIVRNDMNQYNIFIEDLRYSHHMYTNSVLKCLIKTSYSYNYVTSSLKEWEIYRNFDENNQVGWEQIDESFLDYYFTIEVELRDDQDNFLWSFKTLRIHIDPVINDGMVDKVTQIYPEVITTPSLGVTNIDVMLFLTGSSSYPLFKIVLSNFELSHPMYQHTHFTNKLIFQYYISESDTTPVHSDTFFNYDIDHNIPLYNIQFFVSRQGYYIEFFFVIVDNQTHTSVYIMKSSPMTSKIFVPYIADNSDDIQLYPPNS